jgi:hypothetical protein
VARYTRPAAAPRPAVRLREPLCGVDTGVLNRTGLSCSGERRRAAAPAGPAPPPRAAWRGRSQWAKRAARRSGGSPRPARSSGAVVHAAGRLPAQRGRQEELLGCRKGVMGQMTQIMSLLLYICRATPMGMCAHEGSSLGTAAPQRVNIRTCLLHRNYRVPLHVPHRYLDHRVGVVAEALAHQKRFVIFTI